MKTKFLLLMLFLYCISFAQLPVPQVWKTMGSNDFEEFTHSGLNVIKLDNNGVPYGLFDVINIGKRFRKFNGIFWEDFAFNSCPEGNGTFEFSSDNTLYYAYSSSQNSDKLSVSKFNGTVWETVGALGFTDGFVGFETISLDFTSTNIPYVSYRDNSVGIGPMVRKFNGSNWQVVGVGSIGTTLAASTYIKLDANNVPYLSILGTIDVAYGTGSHKIKKFNGFSWVDVASTITRRNRIYPFAFNANNELNYVEMNNDFFLPAQVVKINTAGMQVIVGGQPPISIGYSISIDGNNNIYIVDDSGGVVKYDGTLWVKVGNFLKQSEGTLIFDNNNVGYIHLRDDYNYNNNNGFLYRLNGQNWDLFNCDGISNNKVNFTSVTVANNNVPYIAYQDVAIGSKASVKKYNGTTWTNVGVLGFSAGQAEFICLKTKNNIPFIAYKDLASLGKAVVQKFDGSNWVYVGNQGFSDGEVFNTALAFGASNAPYVAYKDAANANKITVKTFNGTTWVNVGTAGFSAGEVYETSIAVTSNNTVYVAYKDFTNGGKITVQSFNGNQWAIVGSAGFSTGEANFTKIAVDTNDIPTVAYQDVSLNRKAVVKRFNGVIWENLGDATGVSAGRANFIDIVTDSNNVPWIACSDSVFGNDVIVLKYGGQLNWTVMTGDGVSRRQAEYCSIAMNNNNIPVIAYKSQNAFAKFRGPDGSFVLSVIENSITDHVLNIFPNPVKSTFSLTENENIENVIIFDILGKEVLNLKNTSENIDIEFLPKGFYIVNVKTNLSTSSLKIIKE